MKQVYLTTSKTDIYFQQEAAMQVGRPLRSFPKLRCPTSILSQMSRNSAWAVALLRCYTVNTSTTSTSWHVPTCQHKRTVLATHVHVVQNNLTELHLQQRFGGIMIIMLKVRKNNVREISMSANVIQCLPCCLDDNMISLHLPSPRAFRRPEPNWDPSQPVLYMLHTTESALHLNRFLMTCSTAVLCLFSMSIEMSFSGINLQTRRCVSSICCWSALLSARPDDVFVIGLPSVETLQDQYTILGNLSRDSRLNITCCQLLSCSTWGMFSWSPPVRPLWTPANHQIPPGNVFKCIHKFAVLSDQSLWSKMSKHKCIDQTWYKMKQRRTVWTSCQNMPKPSFNSSTAIDNPRLCLRWRLCIWWQTTSYRQNLKHVIKPSNKKQNLNMKAIALTAEILLLHACICMHSLVFFLLGKKQKLPWMRLTDTRWKSASGNKETLQGPLGSLARGLSTG